MLVQLYSGQIQGAPANTTDSAGMVDRAVMLVYEGDFQASTGPVTITPEHINKIAANHNAKHALRLAAGPVEMRECPPIQLDHSRLAIHTIGRVVGPLLVQTVEVEGRPRVALLGTARFLGADNVEKARDGRYTTVSIGANLETGELEELTVTPFPAAPKASLLSKGSTMNKEKMRKRLMETQKCSESDADEMLAKMSDEDQKKLAAEVDEADKKLADEEDAKKKELAAEEEKKKAEMASGDDDDSDDDEDTKKQLSSANAKIAKLTKLAGEAKALLAASHAQARRAEIKGRFDKLRADGKLTPAEQKKLMAKVDEKKDSPVARLSASSVDTIDLVFEFLEMREPVISPGQLGSIKAAELSDVGADVKKQHAGDDMQERLANMPFSRMAIKNTQGEDGGDVKLTSGFRTHADDIEDEVAQPITSQEDAEALKQLRDTSSAMEKLLGVIEQSI